MASQRLRGAEMVQDQGAYTRSRNTRRRHECYRFRTAMKADSLNDNQKMMVFREFFGTIEPKTYEFIRDKLNASSS